MFERIGSEIGVGRKAEGRGAGPHAGKFRRDQIGEETREFRAEPPVAAMIQRHCPSPPFADALYKRAQSPLQKQFFVGGAERACNFALASFVFSKIMLRWRGQTLARAVSGGAARRASGGRQAGGDI